MSHYDEVLSCWTACITDDNHTDAQYGTVWRAVPALILELQALRAQRREQQVVALRRDDTLGKYDRITLGLSELVFDMEARFNNAKTKETIKTLSELLGDIDGFFHPARGEDAL